jgi:phenol 2-monooxygenase
MEGEQTDYIWGVIDLVPDTDFPDIRNRCVIHSNHGSCMVIPREGDLVRLYIQLEGKDILDASGRVNKNSVGPNAVLEVGADISPYGTSRNNICRRQGG